MKKEKAEPKKKNTNDKMARVLRGFAPEPPVVFVILSGAKWLKQECYAKITIPLLEIKDFGPPTAYGEDKELTLNKKSTPLLTSPIRHAVSQN